MALSVRWTLFLFILGLFYLYTVTIDYLVVFLIPTFTAAKKAAIFIDL